MKNSEKKIKAAILGVIHFLQEQEANIAKPKNLWAKSARESIMKNREWQQRRGKMISIGRYR